VRRVVSFIMWVCFFFLPFPCKDLILFHTELGSLLKPLVEVNIFHEDALLRFTRYFVFRRSSFRRIWSLIFSVFWNRLIAVFLSMMDCLISRFHHGTLRLLKVPFVLPIAMFAALMMELVMWIMSFSIGPFGVGGLCLHRHRLVDRKDSS
jgi:hypothetical protein